MYRDARYVLLKIYILYLLLFISAKDVPTTRCRSKRHLLPLLGYLHGYKIGHHFALQLPPFVLSPVIILPSVNQQQSVNVQKSSSDENYQEIGGTLQNISPARLVATIVKGNDTNYTVTEHGNIENVILNNNDLSESDDSLRQANFNETNVTDTTENIDDNITTITYTETTEVDNVNSNTNNVKPHGLYPNATYNNEYLNNLSITIVPIRDNLTVPNTENRWQNFSQPPNEFGNNDTKINTNSTMDIVYSSTDNYSSDTIKSYPYPRSWYNSKVDRLSITTNSYQNEEAALPPTYDDRWQRFSSLRKSYPSSGFRPLAGLYYDGFLHKSLTKEMGFMPYRHNGYYYN